MAKSSVTEIKYLFDRPCHSKEWGSLLAQSESDPAAGVAQVATNWRMDHRVSVEQQEFLEKTDIFTGSDSAEARSLPLPQRAKKFHNGHNCRSIASEAPPSYRQADNHFNRIDTSRINPSTNLVHLVSLSSLLRFTLRRDAPGWGDVLSYLYSRYSVMPPADLSNSQAHTLFCDVLAAYLLDGGETELQQFAEILADALGANEPHWWACFSSEIDSHLEGDDWSDARDLLGLGHLHDGEWLLAWRYPVTAVSALYRPSVLEAADSSFHFPSPPSYQYGLTMPLSNRLLAVPEVIHAPLKGEDSREYCIGRLGKLKRPYAKIHHENELSAWYVSRRQGHRRLLKTSFEKASPWLDRHREPR